MADQIVISIAGIRQFDDCELIFQKLDKVIAKLEKPLKEILVSDESGIAAIVRQYCKVREYRCRVVKTDWEANGDLGAVKRNQELLANAKLMVFFTDKTDKYVSQFIDRALADRVHTKVFPIIRTENTYTYTEEA